MAATVIAYLAHNATTRRETREDDARRALARAAGAYFVRPFVTHFNRLTMLYELAEQASHFQTSGALRALGRGITELRGRGIPALEPVLQCLAAMPVEVSEQVLRVYSDLHHECRTRSFPALAGSECTEAEMKNFVDFELTIPSGQAYGRVSGARDLHIAPEVGDVLSFGISSDSIAIPAGVLKGGNLTVTSRIFGVGSDYIQLALENMITRDMGTAEAVAHYMSHHFSLIVEPYD